MNWKFLEDILQLHLTGGPGHWKRLYDDIRQLFEEYDKWNEATDMPNFDGDYLCHIVRRNECGTFSEYQKVIYCHFNKWTVADNELVTHWRQLPEPPAKNIWNHE